VETVGATASSGAVRILFGPDGGGDFALVHALVVETGARYTFFVHPFSRPARLLEGEVSFDDGPF